MTPMHESSKPYYTTCHSDAAAAGVAENNNTINNLTASAINEYALHSSPPSTRRAIRQGTWCGDSIIFAGLDHDNSTLTRSKSHVHFSDNHVNALSVHQ